jgi:hypothetical protein
MRRRIRIGRGIVLNSADFHDSGLARGESNLERRKSDGNNCDDPEIRFLKYGSSDVAASPRLLIGSGTFACLAAKRVHREGRLAYKKTFGHECLGANRQTSPESAERKDSIGTDLSISRTRRSEHQGWPRCPKALRTGIMQARAHSHDAPPSVLRETMLRSFRLVERALF